jgi:two-component system OmpR family response regulator
VVNDGETALERCADGGYALVVLDLNLPRMSGFDVLSSLRERGRPVPVLVLSAREDVADRVEALQLGADDYVVKPFDFGELHARIDAVMRRSGHAGFAVLEVEDLVVDVVRRRVRRANRDIHLSPRLFELLEFFLRHQGQILTRRRIVEGVWGYSFDTGTNVVDVYVSYLRKAIDADFELKLIQTVHGRGYLLDGSAPR